MAMMLLLALAVAVLGAMAVLQLGYLWHDAGISQMRAATASAQGNQADAARNVTHLHAIGLGPTLLLGAAAGVMMGFALLVIAANRPWERLADWLRPRPRRQIAPATELATAMTAAIHDLETESDPRAAVIACYRRCESALTSRRHRRHQAETPREFLQAAVATTRLPPFPVRALLTVFERARFSELPITASDRAVALSALGEIRSTLEQEGRDGR
jgi:hypothetical protein